MGALLKALGFMTVLPVGEKGREVTIEDVPEMLALFPAAGLVTGLAGTAAAWLVTVFLGGLDKGLAASVPAAVFAVGAMAAMTGGLHLDGLADSFDGLFAPGDHKRRLAVMKDSSIGAFGVSALVLVLAAKWSLVWYILVPWGPWRTGGPPWDFTAAALITSAVLGRWMMLVAAAVGPYARPGGGTGRWFVECCDGKQVITGGVLGLILLVMMLWPTYLSVLWAAPMGAVLFAWAVGWGMLCRRRVGGQTGDTLGAAVEIGEVISLFVIVVVVL